jgi:Flp pilus assembly protein TadD
MKFIAVLFLCSFSFFSQNVQKELGQIDNAIELIREEKFKDALKILTDSKLQKSIMTFEVQNYLGLIHFNLNNYDKAKSYFLESIKLRGDFPESLNNLGYVYLIEGREEKAKELFEHALEIQPLFSAAKKNLILLKRLKYGDLSLASLELFKGANKAKDLQEKVKVYSELLTKHPTFKEVKNNLAVSYYFLGEIKIAEYLFREIIESFPKYAEVYNNLGYLFFGQKKYNLAIRYFLTAVKLQPSYMIALDNLGDIYFELKAYDLAERVWHAAYEVEPLNKTLEYKLNMLDTLRKNM